MNGKETEAMFEGIEERIFSERDQTEEMTETLTDEGPELLLEIADQSGSRKERDKGGVTLGWWSVV